MTKVLFAASEAVPFIKTGGLADVAFSLPKALRKIGVDIRVILPKYKSIPEDFKKKMKFIKSINVPVGWRNQYCGIEYLEYEGVPFYFIDNEYYFKRDGVLYGHYDDGERYAYLCRAILEVIDNIDFSPDVIHCNDWHTGMVAPLLNTFYRDRSKYKDIKTIFTIHNLKYQGIFPESILGDLLGLGSEYYHPDSLEFYGGVSFMKGGIVYSDVINTVSRTYADEIQYPFFGERLDGLLRKRKDDLYGILNGIDYDIYNPKRDALIHINYDVQTMATKKPENKEYLQNLVGLPVDKDVPIVSMVTRLANMKGLDLVLHVLDELLSQDIQMVIVGTGEAYYEEIFRQYTERYPQKFSAQILFNEDLARNVYAGSDIFLMPSMFEPCGLGQLIALRYGTLPVVRETGGLRDTVKSYNEETGEGNGFSFANYNAHDMLYTINRALGLYKDREIWNKIVKNAMDEDYSWNNSARLYRNLYGELL